MVGNHETMLTQVHLVVIGGYEGPRDNKDVKEMLKYKNIFKFFLHKATTENGMVKKAMQDEEAELKKILEEYNVRVIVVGADSAKMKHV